MRNQNARIGSGFSIGEEAAEFDGLLQEAFYETSLYRDIASREGKRCFIIGRTGSGKSACFCRLEETHAPHFIRLSPEDLALPYVTEMDVLQKLEAINVHLDPLFIALWKHVIIIEVIKHRYDVDSPEATKRFLANLMEKLRRDKSKQEALKYLEEFEGRFWCETDERIREILHRFESQVRAEAGGKLAFGQSELSAAGGEARGESMAERTELAARYQRIVHETQLARLNKMVRVLDEDILDSPQHFTYVAIDDLDRDWADAKVTNDLIRCLFRAVVDLKRVHNLKILVALRTNIFESLDFGRTGGQEEKFRALIQRVNWNPGELRELLDSRLLAASRQRGMPHVNSLSEFLPHRNPTRGDPLEYILRRTLMRPRDAIAFLNDCFALATGRDKLTWDGIKKAEYTYSKNRLLALRDEWKPTFPGIDRLLAVFGGSPPIMDWREMRKRLDECALLLADPHFAGSVWLTSTTEPLWMGSDFDHEVEPYLPLVQLLHNIGFIGCVVSKDDPMFHGRSVDEPAIYNYDDPHFTDSVGNLRQVTGYVVHPAFCPALDIH